MRNFFSSGCTLAYILEIRLESKISIEKIIHFQKKKSETEPKTAFETNV